MAIVKPFKGLRPKPEYCKEIASPPYDILSTDEARQIGLKNPLTGGFLNALDLELRYKGNFSPSPQFLGGISDYFKTILTTKNEAKAYTFGKACNG